MLPRRHRIRTSADFSNVVRSGTRSGRRNVVLYAVSSGLEEPSRFGFIVSKVVGNAVTRNLVKRRLRECAAKAVYNAPCGLDVVVRALPPAGDAGWTNIQADFDRTLAVIVKRLEERNHP